MKDFANGETIQLREHQIENNQIRQDGPGAIQRLHAVSRGNDFITFRLQIKRNQFDDVRLIVHH